MLNPILSNILSNLSFSMSVNASMLIIITLNNVVDEVLLCIFYTDSEVIDPLKLEQSLCHVLMDKALLNCLLLLDKADMESRLKTLAVQRFDYSGIAYILFGLLEFKLFLCNCLYSCIKNSLHPMFL